MKVLLLALVAFFVSTSFAAEAKKPNIIFILADDLGWGDTGAYGHPYAKTPHIDSLAREGTRFTRCYATGVTCCPSRTGFMTSKLPATFAKYPATAGFGDRVTITELLKKQGYATAHFGKWHIGPESTVGTYGIDAINADDDAEGGKRKRNQGDRGRDMPMYESAIAFIEKNREGPFYINIWDHIAHHPVNPSEALLAAFGPLKLDQASFTDTMQEKFANCEKQGGDVNAHMRAYLADVKSMDDEIGRLLKRLKELGLHDSTLIAFSSDQGPAGIREGELSEKSMAKKERKRATKANPKPDAEDGTDIRLNAMGSAGPFRGGKHLQYEGGVRIPFILRWPGHVPAGRVDENSVLSGADWLPTLCALAGQPINAADFDGLDASAAWLGKEFIRSKPLFWKVGSRNAATAILDGPWKLHHPNSKRGELELYNISDDPAEASNLVEKEPTMVKLLTAQIAAWHSTLPEVYEERTAEDDK